MDLFPFFKCYFRWGGQTKLEAPKLTQTHSAVRFEKLERWLDIDELPNGLVGCSSTVVTYSMRQPFTEWFDIWRTPLKAANPDRMLGHLPVMTSAEIHSSLGVRHEDHAQASG